MPVVWLIDAYRAGERGQVRALVDALGWPVQTKVLSYRKAVFWPHLLGLSSVAGLTSESAQQLNGPWPDLVVSCGVRNEPVCRWIRKQSGGKTRYVHVGRPWGPLQSFDLVITTPQYRVPDHPHVLNNMLTLHSIDAQVLEQARERWQGTFEHLPRPYFAVVVGGNSGPFTLGRVAAERLGREASQLAQSQGGSLLVTTSSRTGVEAQEALRGAISAPNFFYPWRAGDQNNPYRGILACADRVIVTGDSIAMLSEACATGKPVKMFDLGGMRRDFSETPRDFRLGASLYDLLLRYFWSRVTRDITLVHRRLREAGSAVWMDDVLSTARLRAQNDLQRAVSAVQRLLGES